MCRAQDTREATNSFFCRAFIRKAMETLEESFFSLMSLNLIKKDILDFLTATVVYLQGSLRKKQLKASFRDHFKKICKIRHMPIFSYIILNYVERSAL